MELQRLLSFTRKAIDNYNMILPGDNIAVGISGGKDSLSLLYALSSIRKFYPARFEVTAVTIDLGFHNFDLMPVKMLCADLDVTYHVLSTDIAKILFEERKEKNPCSLCAKLRKGAFYRYIRELSCNKAAYAHHMDDMVETALLSLFFEGRFYCFPPVTYLEQSEITVIRPLMYTPEANLKGFANKYRLPVISNPCPVDGFTKREYVKHVLRQLNNDFPGVKKRIFNAVLEGNFPDWPQLHTETNNGGM